MKLSQVAHITPDRNLPGTPPQKERLMPGNSSLIQRVMAIVDQDPGVRGAVIAARANNHGKRLDLNYYVRRGYLKTRRQDGIMRYYPNNYKFSDEAQPAVTETEVIPPLPVGNPRKQGIDRLLEDVIRSHPEGVEYSQLVVAAIEAGFSRHVTSPLAKLRRRGVFEKRGTRNIYWPLHPYSPDEQTLPADQLITTGNELQQLIMKEINAHPISGVSYENLLKTVMNAGYSHNVSSTLWTLKRRGLFDKRGTKSTFWPTQVPETNPEPVAEPEAPQHETIQELRDRVGEEQGAPVLAPDLPPETAITATPSQKPVPADTQTLTNKVLPIEEDAMRFMWYHPEGTVREFVQWIKEQQ